MTRHYVTAPRAHELPVLLASMERHCKPFLLHILAWDWPPPASPPPYTRIVSRDAFLARHPDIAPNRLPGPARMPVEQVCTARWTFVCDVLEDTGQPVTMVDGDVFFFSSPEPMFDEIGAAGCALSPHRFAPASSGLPGVTVESHGRFGEFNGGWSHWADPAAARWMAEATRQWSYSDFLAHPDGRLTYGDQGLLSLVREQFDAHVIEHVGVNAAPWNVHTQSLRQAHDGTVFFGGRPLVNYHFSSHRPGPGGQLADPHYAVTAEQGRILYEPYRAALAAAIR